MAQNFSALLLPCVIYLQPGTSRLVFRAYSDLGEASEDGYRLCKSEPD